MGILKGKRLLVLTGCLGDNDIVDYALSHGAYVVATDYLRKGEAKNRANIAENVSTVDLVGLRQLSDKHGINGLVTGASLASTRSISILGEQLNLPVPHSAQAISNIDQKDALNRLCRKHRVPAPRQFREADVTKSNLPVIVKPADASNSVGISRVTTFSALSEAVSLAQRHSTTGRMVIEEDLGAGREFIATVIAYRGSYKLAAFCENIKFKQLNGLAGDAVFNFFPSHRGLDLVEEVEQSISSLLRDAGLETGTCSLQLMEHKGELKVYEAGCRLGGTQSYIFSKHEQGTSAMELLVHASLPDQDEVAEEIFAKLDWRWRRLFAQRNVTIRSGYVARLEAPEQNDNSVLNVSTTLTIPGVVASVGDKVGPNVIRAHFVGDTVGELAERIDRFSNSVKICDESGADLRTEHEPALDWANAALRSESSG